MSVDSFELGNFAFAMHGDGRGMLVVVERSLGADNYYVWEVGQQGGLTVSYACSRQQLVRYSQSERDSSVKERAKLCQAKHFTEDGVFQPPRPEARRDQMPSSPQPA